MADVLTHVKNALGITGEYQDNTLTEYINEVKGYIISAGVSNAVTESDTSAGVIARGVADLWINGTLSNYFYQRVTQLSYVTEEVAEDA